MGSTATIPVHIESGLADPEREEITRLRYQNPIYTQYANEWELYQSAYEGGPDIANDRNVFRHQRENEEDFEDRVKRLHYQNYCGPLVDFFTDFIFTETIHRDGGKNAAWYKEFIKDVNKKGDNIVSFMRDVCDDMQIYGMSYILVDTPAAPDVDVISKQTELEYGIRPYWVLIKPIEIIDWMVDDFDKFMYVKRKQLVTILDDAGRVRTKEKYTEWYNDRIKITFIDITDKKSERLENPKTLDNALGIIPIHVVRYKRSKKFPFMGNSFLRDLAYNNREVMNLTSLLQEFLYRQCFNILAKQVDSAIPFADQEEGEIGSSNVMEYPKGAQTPSYISPPADPAQFVQSERQRIVNEMYRQAAQDVLNELFNGEKASGFSQAQSFSKTVPFISTRADVLETTENRLMAITLKYTNNETWDGKVKYKDRYELTNVTDAIVQITSIFRDLLLPSETFAKEELKRLVHELDDKVPTDLMAKIEKEIDEMDFKQWSDTQKQALIGKNSSKGQSPADQQKPKNTGTMAEVANESRVAGTTSATKRIRKRTNS